MANAPVPDEPLAFIQNCIAAHRVRWTYHVSMRLQQRDLTRDAFYSATASLEIIESYPDDKYLPSFLLRGEVSGLVFHAHVATDVAGDNIRVVTMYVPSSAEWINSGRIRRTAR